MPANGQVITFTKVPPSSYCSPGVAYRVERKGKFFHFTNVERGSATSDPAWAVRMSEWAAV